MTCLKPYLRLRDLGGGEGCYSCDGRCLCPVSGMNVQNTLRLVGGYYRNNRTGMNFQLWAIIQQSKGLSEAVMLRINQYVGFMPLRSTHDSPFFRELVNRRSVTQERLADWLRRSIKTIDSSEGITTCLYCLGNVICDLDGKLHEHNCDRIRQHLQSEHRDFIQLFEGARMPTKEGSEERSHQELRILNCPVCKQYHYLPAMCTSDKKEVDQGYGIGTASGTNRLTEHFEPQIVCALEANGTLE